jgi:hypothetical protein
MANGTVCEDLVSDDFVTINYLVKLGHILYIS